MGSIRLQGQNLVQSTFDCVHAIIKQFNERPVLQNEIPGDLPDDAWKAMLAVGDTDKNGKISIDEYKAVMEKQQGGGADNSMTGEH